ncbi:MAG: hypothetical protein IKR48_10500, partial [Kiritimatiellae bacterium]|nr:hypothetical protein [Kiritimatiellia bacterium]
MNRIFILLLLICFGCCHSQHIPLEESRGIYFLSLERTSPFSSLVKRSGYDSFPYLPLERDPEFREYFRMLGIPEAQINAERKDFFFRNDVKTFEFGSVIPCDELCGIVSNYFTGNGWKVKRKILFMEEANCGWQWIRVFEKGKAQIHVEINGVPGKLAKPIPVEKDHVCVENYL